MSSTSTPAEALTSKSSKRVELETLIREFQTKLGSDWDKYHESLSLFLVGKLSRPELIHNITPILKNGLRKYHNKLLLLNFSNSLKDGPLDLQSEFASFWNKKANKTKNIRSSQYEKFKQNIMGLPVKERRRIKNITRESGKKGKLNASITLTRHALLPKIPMIQDTAQQQLQVNNLVQWQQDVVNGINTPIATENYEIPDYDNLSRRILMTMREYGLTGGLSTEVLEMVLLGLDAHLKNIIESAIDVTRYRENKYTTNDFISTTLNSMQPFNSNENVKKRKADSEMDNEKKRKVTLNINDLFDTFEMFPHLIEPSGPKLRLSNIMLQNDDMVSTDYYYELPPRLEPVVEQIAICILKKETPVNKSNGSLHIESKENENKPDTKPLHVIKSDTNMDKADGSSALQKEGSQQSKEVTNNSQQPTTQTQTTSQKLPLPDVHAGTTDELKWMLHDLISTM